MIVGITGNIGAGKSEAAKVFEKHGFQIISADQIGHEILKKENVKEKVLSCFGDSILTNDEIDRSKLKDIVFFDYKKLRKLNCIVHPFILEAISREIEKSKSSNITIEAALLFEFAAKEEIRFDQVILIKSSSVNKIRRAVSRKKYSATEVKNILKAQMPDEEKENLCEYSVENDGSIVEFREKIKNLIKTFKKS